MRTGDVRQAWREGGARRISQRNLVGGPNALELASRPASKKLEFPEKSSENMRQHIGRPPSPFEIPNDSGGGRGADGRRRAWPRQQEERRRVRSEVTRVEAGTFRNLAEPLAPHLPN